MRQPDPFSKNDTPEIAILKEPKADYVKRCCAAAVAFVNSRNHLHRSGISASARGGASSPANSFCHPKSARILLVFLCGFMRLDNRIRPQPRLCVLFRHRLTPILDHGERCSTCGSSTRCCYRYLARDCACWNRRRHFCGGNRCNCRLHTTEGYLGCLTKPGVRDDDRAVYFSAGWAKT